MRGTGGWRFLRACTLTARLSSDELCYKIINMLDLYGVSPLDIEAVILASVVPVLTGRLREALQKMTQAAILEVGPGLKSGVRIRMDNPAQPGRGAAVRGRGRAAPPRTAADCDEPGHRHDAAGRGRRRQPGGRRDFAGAAAFAGRAGEKHRPAAAGGAGSPRRLLGANTPDCLRSGMVYGTAAPAGCDGRQDARGAPRAAGPGRCDRHAAPPASAPPAKQSWSTARR